MTKAVSNEIIATINQWRPKLLALGDEAVHHKPSSDRWSIAEVIGHLVDSASNNHQRFVRAQACDTLVFPAYDQNAWVVAGNYNQFDWPSLVGLWHLYNRLIAHVIRNVSIDQLDTPCTITPNETCTLQFLIDDYLVHLKHHLKKISERVSDPM